MGVKSYFFFIYFFLFYSVCNTFLVMEMLEMVTFTMSLKLWRSFLSSSQCCVVKRRRKDCPHEDTADTQGRVLAFSPAAVQHKLLSKNKLGKK